MTEYEPDDQESRIEDAIYARAASDSGFAIAYALLQVCKALHDIEYAVNSVSDSIDGGLEKIAPKSATKTFLDEIGAP